MIDEGVLAALLTEHAQRIPVPESAIDAVLGASRPADQPRALHRFPRPPLRMLAAAVTVVVAAGGVWALSAQTGRGSAVASKRVTDRAQQLGGPIAAAPPGPLVPAGRGAAGATVTHGAAPKYQYAAGATTNAGTTAAARDDARVIRTGTLEVTVARHTFGRAIGRITTIASGAGGFISDARTFESAATPTGTVTLRVPSPRFNTTVSKLRSLGTVVSASTRGVDVSGQYTDLQARLRAATATRDQYLTVLGHAVTIGDILAVQDRIESVQTAIDQLQGQINGLDNQTTYATITVSVTEPPPKPKPVVRPGHPSGMSVAWSNARNGFSRRVEGIVSHSGSVLVVLIALLLLGAAVRLLFPRVRRLLV